MSSYSANIHSIPSTSTPPFRIVASLSGANNNHNNQSTTTTTSRTSSRLSNLSNPDEDSPLTMHPPTPTTPTLNPLATHSSTYTYTPPEPLPNWNYPPSALPAQLQSRNSSFRDGEGDEEVEDEGETSFLSEDLAISPHPLDSPSPEFEHPPSNRASSILLSTIPEEQHGLLNGLDSLASPGHRDRYEYIQYRNLPTSDEVSGQTPTPTSTSYININGNSRTRPQSLSQSQTQTQSQRNSTSTFPSTARTSLFHTNARNSWTTSRTWNDDTHSSPASSTTSSPKEGSPAPLSRKRFSGSQSNSNSTTQPQTLTTNNINRHSASSSTHRRSKPPQINQESLASLTSPHPSTTKNNSHTKNNPHSKPTPTPGLPPTDESSRAAAIAEANAWGKRYDTAQPSGKAMSVKDEEYLRLVAEFRRGVRDLERRDLSNGSGNGGEGKGQVQGKGKEKRDVNGNGREKKNKGKGGMKRILRIFGGKKSARV